MRDLHVVEHAAHHIASSLQSNWNASPNSKLKGTNALAGLLSERVRHARMKSVTAL